MDSDDSPGLLKFILGFFARKPAQKPARSASLKSQALDAWLRADAYLQHETGEFNQRDPEQVARTLRAFENLVQYDSNRESDSVSNTILRHTYIYTYTHIPLIQSCGPDLTAHGVVPKASGDL